MFLTGHTKYSLLGWSDGGITAIVLAAKYSDCIDRLVVWGANATVTAQDIELYEKIRDTSKWSQKMREPLEGNIFYKRCFLWITETPTVTDTTSSLICVHQGESQ